MQDVAKPQKVVFMFGNGDMGQLGLGPDTLDEIPRPRVHAWSVPVSPFRRYPSDQPGSKNMRKMASSAEMVKPVADLRRYTLAVCTIWRLMKEAK